MSWYQRALPNSKNSNTTKQWSLHCLHLISDPKVVLSTSPTTGLCSIEAKAWKNSPLHFQCQLGTSRQMKISILSSKDVNDCMYIIQFVIFGEKTCTQATQHVISTHFAQFIISTEPNRNHEPVTGSGRRSRSARSRASFSCCNFKMASWNHGSPRKDHQMYVTTKDFEPRKMEERAMGHLYVYKQIWRCSCTICTYRYLELNWPLFSKVNPPKTRPLFQSKQGSFGFQDVPGIEFALHDACDRVTVDLGMDCFEQTDGTVCIKRKRTKLAKVMRFHRFFTRRGAETQKPHETAEAGPDWPENLVFQYIHSASSIYSLHTFTYHIYP